MGTGGPRRVLLAAQEEANAASANFATSVETYWRPMSTAAMEGRSLEGRAERAAPWLKAEVSDRLNTTVASALGIPRRCANRLGRRQSRRRTKSKSHDPKEFVAYSELRPITRAGFPATTAKSGTSLVTTDPAPTVAQFPTRNRGRIVAFVPM